MAQEIKFSAPAKTLATATTASAAAAMAWIFFEIMCGKKPSVMWVCIGAVVGLVAITAAAGVCTVQHSFIVCVDAACGSNLVVIWRLKHLLVNPIYFSFTLWHWQPYLPCFFWFISSVENNGFLKPAKSINSRRNCRVGY
jgi:ammonia channel protein AmtB